MIFYSVRIYVHRAGSMNTSEAAAKLLTSDEGTTVCYEVIKVNEAIALTLNVQLPCKYVGKCTFRTLQRLCV